MQYMLSLIGEEPNWEDVSPRGHAGDDRRDGQYNDELKEAGVMVDGHGLRERATASVVRFSGDERPSPTAPSPRPRSS